MILAYLQIYRESLSRVTFLRVHSNSKKVSYLFWNNTYPNLKTTCHFKLKFSLWNKLLENLLFAKYLISVTVHLNFIKRELQQSCFLVKYVKFWRAPILKNICERLLLFRPIFLFYAFWKHYFIDFFLFLFYFLMINLLSSLIVLKSVVDRKVRICLSNSIFLNQRTKK